MTTREQAAGPFSNHFLQAWIYQPNWSLEEAILLALGVSPDTDKAKDVLAKYAALISRTKRAGIRSGDPCGWLWWAERNGVPFDRQWWLAISPEGPNGFDGSHFVNNRTEMLSDRFLEQERRLIGKWARKPYWTSREAIDLSLNFDPFTTDGWRCDAPETGPTIREREDRFRILERALEFEEITEKARPVDYVQWLETRNYYVSEAWRRAVGMAPREAQTLNAGDPANLTSELADLQQQLKTKSLRITELETQLHNSSAQPESQEKEIRRLRQKIDELTSDPETPGAKGAQAKRVGGLEKALLAAAVDGLSYDPRSSKSDVPRQITEKAKQLGYGLTDQTIRKYLKESADNHVSRETWDVIYPTK